VAHLAVVIAEDREAWRAALRARGIATDVHYPVPDHQQPVVSVANASSRLPVTEWACDRVFSVPCYPQLTNQQVDQVCEGLGSR
jgi:dTDP-4-amino-4,6-dideoxygalactose transaminase